MKKTRITQWVADKSCSLSFHYLRYAFCFCALLVDQSLKAQNFENTIGEVISYFSPFHEFAPQSLLTRANGQSPIEWEVQNYKSQDGRCEFKFLIGHSTGTSSGLRNFDWLLNGKTIFTFQTKPKQKGKDNQHFQPSARLTYSFEVVEYDINQDVFGWLTISVPSQWVQDGAHFEVKGQDHKSRDWLMFFPYTPTFDIIATPTALITRKEHKRQLNLAVLIPNDGSQIQISSTHFHHQSFLKKGYHLLSIPAYPIDFVGMDTITCVLNNLSIIQKVIRVEPTKDYTFHVIHHSHNDIGYSHHQSEVETIQTKNIRTAIRWAQREPMAIWHIESLWAVENFLRNCTPQEEQLFVDLIRNGNIVLSANYANVLTGLCDPKELPWILEYAKHLSEKYNISIQNAMMTDIPGITYQGLANYTHHHIPYLSLGPNYVDNHTDKGDRVGSVIQQTGDTWFYWTSKDQPNEKVLVGTAGKGYSYFHNIQENEKTFKWENKISQYVAELSAKNYPWEDIQLRYTKNADNGPVDTLLVEWIKEWNEKFTSPKLVLQSIDQLFDLMEKKYSGSIPIKTGEISPYWEDGAYSTAKEEIEMRQLVKELVEIEDNLPFQKAAQLDLYPLHRNIVLFHEHTWGSWCSISDPYSPFTQSQWIYKKAFLDSAQAQMSFLREQIKTSPILFDPTIIAEKNINPKRIQNFALDTLTGGIAQMKLQDGYTISFDHQPFWQGVYQYQINPSQTIEPRCTSHNRIETKEYIKEMATLQYPLPCSIDKIFVEYKLDKQSGQLNIDNTILKEPILTKESMHFSLGLPNQAKRLSYGLVPLRYPEDQLPGSNKEFICTDQNVVVQYDNFSLIIKSPDINLFEIGGIINENQINGAKVWQRNKQDIDQLYLYVFNNYWHTNYKAEQGGDPIHWKVQIEFSPLIK